VESRTRLHTTSGRWKLGVSLTLLAVLMWGLLPIALAGLLRQMDALTIAWYRLLTAGVVLIFPVARARGLRPLRGAGRDVLLLLTVAGLSLAANYVLYVLCLRYVTPSTAQVVIQLAPMFMLLGGLIVFRETFGAVQRLGLALLVLGLLLFFNDEIPAMFSGRSPMTAGLLLLLGASVTWASYALAQKQLLRTLGSTSIMMVIYITGAVLLAPFAHPAAVADLDTTGVALLAFLALNTLVAYGGFSEALAHLEASRVSVVISLGPVVTIAAVALGARVWPAVVMPERLDALGFLGAGLVVAGSMLGAAGRPPGPRRRLLRPLRRPF
jgi:drug/metabolite transporter (DMT)-like permease